MEDPTAEGLEARLDDACFSEGRIIGLEQRGDDCALRLGLSTTGVWEQTMAGCEDGETAWSDLHVDAVVPEGATLEVSYRLMRDVIVPVGLPWTPVDGDTLDLADEPGRFLEVRVELRKADGGEGPELRGVSAGRVCAPQ